MPRRWQAWNISELSVKLVYTTGQYITVSIGRAEHTYIRRVHGPWNRNKNKFFWSALRRTTLVHGDTGLPTKNETSETTIRYLSFSLKSSFFFSLPNTLMSNSRQNTEFKLGIVLFENLYFLCRLFSLILCPDSSRQIKVNITVRLNLIYFLFKLLLFSDHTKQK